MTEQGHGTSPPGAPDMLPVLYEQPAPAPTSALIERTLQRDTDTYLTSKRRRLTASSEGGYRRVLDELVNHYPELSVTDFEPHAGALLIEDFLAARWGHLSPRTYNKAFSVLHDFFEWYVARGVLTRDPMATLERAKTRQVHRTTFTDDQRSQILAANPEPREQIALRLLLDYGIRKGALRGVRFEHFDTDMRRLTVFTKGETIHTFPIPDETVWVNLTLLDEQPTHYLLPKQLTRKRIPPRRAELAKIGALLDEARTQLTAAADDQSCARELAQLLTAIDDGARWHGLATEAASTRVRYSHDDAIGEHGAHLWWYRCLQRAGIVDRGVARGQRMHKARHSAGQRILEVTGNLKAVQVALGHKNVGTTGDTYTGWEIHQQESTMRDVVAAKERP